MSRCASVCLVLLLAASANALQFSTNGPYDLTYPAVTSVAASAQAVYAAAGGKLYRSADHGVTWIALSVPPSSIDALAVDPANGATLYVNGATRTYRSDDSGATWTDLSARVGPIHPVALLVDPQNPSTLYIGGRCEISPVGYLYGGVHKSTDRGATWAWVNVGENECLESLSLDPGAPQRLFSYSTVGHWSLRTDDAARTWRFVHEDIPAFDVVADPVVPSQHYGLGRADDGTLLLLASDDSGATWRRVASTGLPRAGQHLAIDPVTRRLYLSADTYGLFVSDDLGAQWTRAETVPASPADMASLGAVVYVATGEGLYRMPEAAKTILGELAPQALNVAQIALDPADAATLYATGSVNLGSVAVYRVFRSRDSGRSWQRITAEDDRDVRIAMAVDAAGDLYATGLTDRIWRFAKATETWESWQPPNFGTSLALYANPRRPGWLYAGRGAARYSTDGGRSWLPLSGGPTWFQSLSIAPNGSDLVAGDDQGVYVSNDGGAGWRLVAASGTPVLHVAIAPSRPSTIYRVEEHLLFRSDDGGSSWTALAWPGDPYYAGRLTVDPLDDRSVWAGLRHSSDGGATWTTEPANTWGIESVVFDRDGTVLYCTAGDYGVWQATVRSGHARRRAVR